MRRDHATMLSLLAALLVFACLPEPVAPDPQLPEPDGATPCARACARLSALDCPESEPTPAGASCEQVCENVESSGVLTMGPECVARVGSCADVASCTESVRQH